MKIPKAGEIFCRFPDLVVCLLMEVQERDFVFEIGWDYPAAEAVRINIAHYRRR